MPILRGPGASPPGAALDCSLWPVVWREAHGVSTGDLVVFGGCGFIGLNIAEAAAARAGEHGGRLADRQAPPSRGSPRQQLRHPARGVRSTSSVDVDRRRPQWKRSSRQHRPRRACTTAPAITSGPDPRARPPGARCSAGQPRGARHMPSATCGSGSAVAALDQHQLRRRVWRPVASAAGGGVAPLDERGRDPVRCPSSLYSVSEIRERRALPAHGGVSPDWTPSQREACRSIFGPWELDTGFRDTLSAPMQAAILARDAGRAATVVARRDARGTGPTRAMWPTGTARAHARHRISRRSISTTSRQESHLFACSISPQALAAHFPGFSVRES